MFKYLKNKLKEKIFHYEVSEEDDNTIFERTNTKIWLYANYTVIFFIFLSIIIVFLDWTPEIKKDYLLYIFIADFIISSIFLFEYIYRFSISDEKIKFTLGFLNILDLLSFLPFFILLAFYWFWSYTLFAVFRIFRVLRIFELIERIPIIRNFLNQVYKYRIEFLSGFLLVFITLFISSVIVYFTEQLWWNPSIFKSIWFTFWWSILTFTTTWYSEALVPNTFIWKIIASFLMFIWPILITVISSIISIIFLNTTKIINFWKEREEGNKE